MKWLTGYAMNTGQDDVQSVSLDAARSLTSPQLSAPSVRASATPHIGWAPVNEPDDGQFVPPPPPVAPPPPPPPPPQPVETREWMPPPPPKLQPPDTMPTPSRSGVIPARGRFPWSWLILGGLVLWFWMSDREQRSK